MSEAPINILCIDGGGMRGLIALSILEHLESKTKGKLFEQFDLICGTSTGGIIALGLLKGKTVSEMKQLYHDMGSKLFVYSFGSKTKYLFQSAFGEADYYGLDNLEKLLRENLGEELIGDLSPSKEKKRAHTFIVATECSSSHPVPYLFKNYSSVGDDDLTKADSGKTYVLKKLAGSHKCEIYKAATASSAAPTYFKSLKIGNKQFVDGGLMANNATMLAIEEASSIWPSRKIGLVVNVGTGMSSRGMKTNFNLLSWGKATADICTCSEKTAEQVKGFLKLLSQHGACDPVFLRFSPPSLGDDDLATTDIERWKYWENETEKFMRTPYTERYTLKLTEIMGNGSTEQL